MPDRRHTDRGSVLMLMPAAVLVMVVLGAFAVDATLAFLGERELSNLSAGIANDIAGAAINDEAFYREGALRLDPTRATRIRDLSFSTYTPQYLTNLRITNLTLTDATVTITLTASINYLFSPALPRTPTTATLSATSTATARQG